MSTSRHSFPFLPVRLFPTSSSSLKKQLSRKQTVAVAVFFEKALMAWLSYTYTLFPGDSSTICKHKNRMAVWWLLFTHEYINVQWTPMKSDLKISALFFWPTPILPTTDTQTDKIKRKGKTLIWYSMCNFMLFKIIFVVVYYCSLHAAAMVVRWVKVDSYLVLVGNCLGNLSRSWSFPLLSSIFRSSPALIELLGQQLILLLELPVLSEEVTALCTVSGSLRTFASHWQWVGPWPLHAKGWSWSRC